MYRTLKSLRLLSLVAIAGFSLPLFAPAALAGERNFRGDRLLRDVGIGAAAGVVSGAVTQGNGNPLDHVINGAAAGAVVNTADREFRRNNQRRDLGRDVGVGAGAGLVTGTIVNDRNALDNTINGAAAGAAIHLLTR